MTQNRERLVGVGVGKGAVVGPVVVSRPPISIPADEPARGEDDVVRVHDAFDEVAASLEQQAVDASDTLSQVLAATAQMASDPVLRQDVAARIRAGSGPARAVHDAVEEVCATLEAAGGYLAERTTDLRSVRDRVVARVLDVPEPGVGRLVRPSVIVATDLSPADTAALEITQVLAIVTELGGPTSHTVIIAAQLGIPCVVQVHGAAAVPAGTMLAVDASAGYVVLNPDDTEKQAVQERRRAMEALAGDTAPGATSDGHSVALLANVGTVEDALSAADGPAEGVGLLRTEVLFLNEQTAPSVEQQSASYERVLSAFGDRKVVVRTLDAGADKPLAFANQTQEDNPALGVRGYRLVRTMPDLLDTQLAALAHARRGPGADLWVMAPMIATPEEARAFRERARAAGLTRVGVMVEVPAAALMADALLREVDFVSLGTNDLAQYAMATDRLRGELSDLLDPWQPAVLKLVAATAEAGVRAAKPVGVCGESASDPLMALVLAGLGVTSLSMAPVAMPLVRAALRQHTLEQCRRMAAAATEAVDARTGREAVLQLVAPGLRALIGG